MSGHSRGSPSTTGTTTRNSWRVGGPRLPSLLRRRPLLRAAAIGAGAHYLGKRQMEAEQRQLDDKMRGARRLERLHSEGALTDGELVKQKAKLLGC
jgi:hypothetical protein